MTLLAIYEDLQAGRCTLEQAAERFGTNPRALKIRLTKQGARIVEVLTTLDLIADDLITRDEAAVRLQSTVRNVNSLMEGWGVRRPIKAYRIQRAATSIKWDLHHKCAVDFIAGRLNLDKASELASVSTRQMRRVVSQLIGKHAGLVYKDLGHLTFAQLQDLARKIEAEESVDVEVVEEVRGGRVSLDEAALRRVLPKANKEFAHERHDSAQVAGGARIERQALRA